MINEKQFVENYLYFWNTVLPLSKFFLRDINMNRVKSDTDFLASDVSGRRRSFLSEVAFKLLKDSYEQKYELINEIIVYQRLSIIEDDCRRLFKSYEKDEKNITDTLVSYEIIEIIELSKRMKKFLDKYFDVEQLEISPQFIGCGLLETCYGDILVNNTLLEVKMVKRNFQMNDFKQLITYCALNSISNTHIIERVGLYNPRQGKYIIYDLNIFCISISGKTASTLLGEIIEYISSGELSK